MNAQFITAAGDSVRIEDAAPDDSTPPLQRTSLVVSSGLVTLIVPLRRAEARAVASSLMGAAAELEQPR